MLLPMVGRNRLFWRYPRESILHPYAREHLLQRFELLIGSPSNAQIMLQPLVFEPLSHLLGREFSLLPPVSIDILPYGDVETGHRSWLDDVRLVFYLLSQLFHTNRSNY